MSALTSDQIELMLRAQAGHPPWGGNVPLIRLQAELELLLAMHLVEADGEAMYRLTALGDQVLAHLLK